MILRVHEMGGWPGKLKIGTDQVHDRYNRNLISFTFRYFIFGFFGSFCVSTSRPFVYELEKLSTNCAVRSLERAGSPGRSWRRPATSPTTVHNHTLAPGPIPRLLEPVPVFYSRWSCSEGLHLSTQLDPKRRQLVYELPS